MKTLSEKKIKGFLAFGELGGDNFVYENTCSEKCGCVYCNDKEQTPIVYKENDVKEAIKRLKEKINLQLGEPIPYTNDEYWGNNTLDFFDLIKEIFGEELTKCPTS